MKTISINREWKMSFPEGFQILNDMERRRLNFIGGAEGVCLSDPERHVVVSVGEKQINGFSALVLSGKDLAKRMEKQISKPMEAYDYHLEGFFTRQIADKTASGFRYTYKSQGVEMLGESYVVKDGKHLVYFHLYARKALREESLAVWNGILDTIGA